MKIELLKTTMRYLIICLTFLVAPTLHAQDCVDPSLINPEAICPMIYAPVCGCDGNTYDNDCLAINYGGVTSWTDGPCIGGNDCLDLSGLDFGPCDMFLGYAWIGTGCVGMSGCGYTIGEIDYSPNFYSLASECQQACGNVATDCVNYSQIEQGYLIDCVSEPDTVCGCDGITYDNPCMAYYIGGVTTYSTNSCEDSSCFIIPQFVDFGECAMPLGWRRTITGCVEQSGCSYIGQNGYDYSAYFFTSSYECGSQCIDTVIIDLCIDSSLIDNTMACIEIYDPVCGCDSITYSNSCYATYYGGVLSYTPGECTTGISDINMNKVSLFPNPANDLISLKSDVVIEGKLQIHDISGKIQIEQFVKGSNIEINIAALPPGIYTLQLMGTKNQNVRKKFMKN